MSSWFVKRSLKITASVDGVHNGALIRKWYDLTKSVNPRLRTQGFLSTETPTREGLGGSPLPLPSENCPPKKPSLLLRVQIMRLPSFPPLCPHHKPLQHHAQRARSRAAKLRMPKKARMGCHYRSVSSMEIILTAPLQTPWAFTEIFPWKSVTSPPTHSVFGLSKTDAGMLGIMYWHY